MCQSLEVPIAVRLDLLGPSLTKTGSRLCRDVSGLAWAKKEGGSLAPPPEETRKFDGNYSPIGSIPSISSLVVGAAVRSSSPRNTPSSFIPKRRVPVAEMPVLVAGMQ